MKGTLKLAGSVAAILAARGMGIIVGLGVSAMLASRLGASAAADSFLFARRLAQGQTESIARAVRILLVPSFVASLHKGDREGTRRFVRRNLLVIGGVSLVAAIAVAAIAPLLVSIWGGGFDAERHSLATANLRVLIFLVPAGLIGGLGISALNAAARFGKPAFLSHLPRIVLLGALVFLVPPLTVVGLSWMLLAGSVLAALAIGALMGRLLRTETPPSETPRTNVPETVDTSVRSRVLPTILVCLYGEGSIWIDLAFLSAMSAGGVTMLEHGSKLMRLVPYEVGMSLLYVLYTEFSQRAVANDMEGLQRRLVGLQRSGLFLILPIVAFQFITSGAMVNLVLLRGAYTPEAAIVTVDVMRLVAPSVLFSFLANTFIFALYVDGSLPRGRLLGYLAAFGLVARLVFNFLLTPKMGVLGVALTSSLATGSVVLFAYLLMKRYWGRFWEGQDFLSLARIGLAVIASTAVMVVAHRTMRLWLPGRDLETMIRLATIGGLGAGSYLGAAKLLRVREMESAYMILEKLRSKISKAAGRSGGSN